MNVKLQIRISYVFDFDQIKCVQNVNIFKIENSVSSGKTKREQISKAKIALDRIINRMANCTN